MRVLVDECVDPRVKLLFAGHDVATVHEQGWDAYEDGLLLTVAQEKFDVLVTIDTSLEFQQNLSKFQIGVVVVRLPKNQLVHYELFKRIYWMPSRRFGAVAQFTSPHEFFDPGIAATDPAGRSC